MNEPEHPLGVPGMNSKHSGLSITVTDFQDVCQE